MPTVSKIQPLSALTEILGAARRSGLRIVFTNGCFDLIHVGHVRYLTAAREQGDLLVVGLNSDRSVQRIKGPLRPVIPEAERAEVLAALTCVDYVVLFDEPDPLHLIRQVRPLVLVKGADWPEAQIIGSGFVKSTGGRVERIPFVPGRSTTGIIDRIVRRFGPES